MFLGDWVDPVELELASEILAENRLVNMAVLDSIVGVPLAPVVPVPVTRLVPLTAGNGVDWAMLDEAGIQSELVGDPV